ncbi:hypothetical protein AB0K00_24045 [Dactylosporangium sp. NPDC049525]|uniref:hypothetical protein n=1 Tax=Dactylosporangium sp. NPDC049525 TaxID=3154730 RepID=UPI0034467BAE
MDQLTDALRDLDPPAPPSSVDLDAVVRRAHRHRRRTRVLTAVTVAVAVAVTAMTVPLVTDRHRDRDQGQGPNRGQGSQSAMPRMGCVPLGRSAEPPGTDAAQAAARLDARKAAELTAALDGPLRQALPGATLVDAASCEPGFAFRAHRSLDGVVMFNAVVVVDDGAGSTQLTVQLNRRPLPPEHDCTGAGGVPTCVREVEEDGTIMYRASRAAGGGGLMLVVDRDRPDGVHVQVTLRNYYIPGSLVVTLTRPGLPLDETALTALARIEGLTM